MSNFSIPNLNATSSEIIKDIFRIFRNFYWELRSFSIRSVKTIHPEKGIRKQTTISDIIQIEEFKGVETLFFLFNANKAPPKHINGRTIHQRHWIPKGKGVNISHLLSIFAAHLMVTWFVVISMSWYPVNSINPFIHPNPNPKE
jgi:hypothetical protein